MNKIHISNLNSLSALFDRLIVENIKMNYFDSKGDKDRARKQSILVEAIRSELNDFFLTTITEGKYSYYSENRTFELKKKVDEFTKSVNSLCECHSNITSCDGQKLQEAKSETPDMELILKLEYKNRENLEKRASDKNKLDQLYEDILHTTKQDKSELH